MTENEVAVVSSEIRKEPEKVCEIQQNQLEEGKKVENQERSEAGDEMEELHNRESLNVDIATGRVSQIE